MTDPSTNDDAGPLKLSVSVDPRCSGTELVAASRDLEAAGADVLWVPEAYGRDAVSQLGMIIAATDRVEVGSGVLNVFSRTPALLAQTAATLDELSGGRFVLGIGASGPQVIEGWHGMPYRRPLGRVRDVIAVCRSVLARERLEHEGAAVTVPRRDPDRPRHRPLKLSSYPPRPRIPIWVAALGPRSVEVTAAEADGWLPFLFLPDRAGDVWGEALAAGRAARPADLEPLQVCAGVEVEITDDPARIAAARDRRRPQLARYLGGMGSREVNFYNRIARAAGFERDAEEVQRRYLAGDVAGAQAALSDELLAAATVCGPRAEVIEQLDAHRRAGVTHLKLPGTVPDLPDTIAHLKELLS